MNKDKIYTIRFTEKEWDGICNRADKADVPVSQYIRRMIDLGERHSKGSASTDALSW